MATERQKQIALGAVLVVLAVVLYRAVMSVGVTSGGAVSPSNTAGRTARAGGAAPAATAPDVHLRNLDAERPKPGENERNLFRFRPKAPPPAARATEPVLRPAPSAPVGPPPPAPIPLKFIGSVEAPAQGKRLAALVAATGHPYHGAEGDIVAGQYRVVKIGVES